MAVADVGAVPFVEYVAGQAEDGARTGACFPLDRVCFVFDVWPLAGAALMTWGFDFPILL